MATPPTLRAPPSYRGWGARSRVCAAGPPPGVTLPNVSALVVLLAIGATFRCTWLITTDDLTVRLRAWATRWDWLHDLVSCPWCTSPYVAAAAFTTGWAYGTSDWWQISAGLATASGVTGLLATLAED